MTKRDLMNLLLEKARQEIECMETLKDKDDSISNMMFWKHSGRGEGFNEIYHLLRDMDLEGKDK